MATTRPYATDSTKRRVAGLEQERERRVVVRENELMIRDNESDRRIVSSEETRHKKPLVQARVRE